MKKITSILTAVIVAAMLFTACGSDYEKYINEVKDGYLGGCLDVTVGEVFAQSIPGGSWDSGETDEGKIIVEYDADIEDMEITMQFTVTDENHFHLSAMVVDGMSPESMEEAGSLIESRYTSYYGIKYPDKAAFDFLPNEPSANMTNGISAALAEKAKNPVDISAYLKKSSDELKSGLALEDEDGFLKNEDMFILYDDVLAAVDTASVSGRGYSLFGAAPYMPIDTALANVADAFTEVSGEDNYDGTYSVLLIKNGSEDSLIIKYDSEYGLTGEITYMKDGFLGYSEMAAEEELQNTASWEEVSGGSFVCRESGADVFIGTETEYMQPYIEGFAGDGYTEVYGTLTVITDSKLSYNSDVGGFNIIVYDADSIEITDASGNFAAFGGSYERYYSVKAG